MEEIVAAPFYRSHAIAIFAALGALSGGIAAMTWPLLVVPAVIYGIPLSNTISLSPGTVFAVALAVGIGLTVTRRVAPIAAMIAATIFGWWIVVEFAAHPAFMSSNAFIDLAHWFACGLVGALIVGVTGAIVGLYDRSVLNLAEIGIIGAVVGLLVLWTPQTNFWLLLVAWQAAVGAAIGHAIVRSPQGTISPTQARTIPG